MNNKRLNRLFDYVFAEKVNLTFENRLFLSAIIIGLLGSFIGFFVSLMLSSPNDVLIVISVLFIFLTILYHFVRFKGVFKLFIFPLILFSFTSIATIWVFDGGINGSNLFPGFVVLILSLIVVSDKQKKYVLLLFITFVVIIYLIQFYRPDLITDYSSEKHRWFDSLFTAIYSSFFIFLIIRFFHKHYAKEKLRAEINEEKFRTLSENSQDFITRFDKQHKYVYANPAVAKSMDLEVGQLIGKTIHEVGGLSEEQCNLFNEIIDKVFQSKLPHSEQLQIENQIEKIFIDLRAFPEFNEKNEVVSVLGVARDITKIKQSEIELLKLNADKDLFMSVLAHDLKNPFNSILGFSGLLIENIRNNNIETTENQLGIIHDLSVQTYNLMEDLLLWVKSQSGKLNFNPQLIDFSIICEEIVDNVKLMAHLKNIKISYVKKRIDVLADENMLKIIMRNLISNAIKFTMPNGKIKIDIEEKETDILITVSDTGVGIDKNDIEKLWEIKSGFSTAGTANETGTGFGLVLCKEFVEKHNGKIWVESEVDKGSDFKFTLPLK